MLWRNRRQSTNVEDRRGIGGGGLAVGGGLGTLVVVLIAYFLGLDPQALLDQGARDPTAPQVNSRPAGPAANAEEEELRQFVAVVLAETEDVWGDIFRQQNLQYREPKLVLFTGRTPSACGTGTAATGPFYCPGDERVYIDLSFFRDLKNRFRAPGDFAQAYVTAHEVGHHVQNLLGTMDKVNAAQGRLRAAESNQLSVRVELQADFYAGLWAHYAIKKGIVERGDVEEALRAAAAVGDDRLQSQAQGYAVPDSFTHGTSEQRARWFRRGLETGDIRQGNTFAAKGL